jgi:ribosomal protein S27AE
MRKLICNFFKHKWRWFETYHEEDGKLQSKFRVCKRCGEVEYQKWHMTALIWARPIEYNRLGAENNIEHFDED